MEAIQAVSALCKEYSVSPYDDNGDIDFRIKLRMEWIEQKIPFDKREEFIKKVLLTQKSEYKTLPSLATFEELLNPKQSTDELEQVASVLFFQLVNKVNIYKDFITDDTRIQAGLNAIGGWKALCNSNINQHQWDRKSFIRAFVLEATTPMTTCLRNPGIGKTKKYVYLGNQEKCLQIALNKVKVSQIESLAADIKAKAQ